MVNPTSSDTQALKMIDGELRPIRICQGIALASTLLTLLGAALFLPHSCLGNEGALWSTVSLGSITALAFLGASKRLENKDLDKIRAIIIERGGCGQDSSGKTALHHAVLLKISPAICFCLGDAAGIRDNEQNRPYDYLNSDVAADKQFMEALKQLQEPLEEEGDEPEPMNDHPHHDCIQDLNRLKLANFSAFPKTK